MLLYTAMALSSILGSSAAPLQKRAGGPASVPIPFNCTIVNPLPHSECTIGSTSGYKLDDDFNSTNVIYQAYYDSSLSLDDTWTQCLEQCYGYSTPGTCKSALLAYNVPTPAGWFGTKGGDISPTACLMYGVYPDPDDFEAAPSGQYINETAGSIYCGF